MIRVRVGKAAFDAGAELDALATDGAGAIASFIGIVRGDGGLTSLTLEHYPAMTERILECIVDAAVLQWSLSGATVVHRVGPLSPGDRIVFVGTTAAHRAAALEACAFIIDALKTRAPFWKRETFFDGRDAWVEARAGDDAAMARWT